MTELAKDARLARLVAVIQLGAWDALRALRGSAPAGEPDEEWREAYLMSHLFAGFPRTVEAGEVLARVGGLGSPEPGELMEADPADGPVVFQRIYGDRDVAVRSALGGYHALLERWVIAHAYGRVLGRPGLSLARREKCAVAALAAAGLSRQLASHARGAVRAGASAADLERVLDAIEDLVSPAPLAEARLVVARFASPES